MAMTLKNLALFIFFLLSFFHSRAQDIETIKVKDNLYMVGDRTYSLFYVTDLGVVVIDPLDERHASATMSAIRKVTDLPVTHLFYSHNHWDHISGGQIFKDQGAKIISHKKAKEKIVSNPLVLRPDKVWNGSQRVFHIGDKELEVFFYGRNHGDGMTVFRFPEHNIVFTVDLVVPDRVLYAYLPDADPKNWMISLRNINDLEFETLLMSHVRAIGSRKDLELMQDYFEDLYTAVQLELEKGTNLFEIPKTVRLPKYQDWMMYEEWLPMNVWRILMEKSIGQ